MITSFAQLEVNEVGLDYSGITKTISKNIYVAGIHFLGVAHSFIKFPMTVQTYEFTKDPRADGPQIKSRTQDGLEVELEVSFQYIYISNQLFDLYMKYGENYRTPCQKVAIDVLTDTATRYKANRFFFDKEVISTEMQGVLNTTFAGQCYGTVELFQLKNIDLPNDFEKAIQQTEVMRQDIHKAEAQKSKMFIELETKVKQATIASEIQVNKAEGDASALITKNKAQAESFYKIQSNQAIALGEMKKALGFSASGLIDYLKAKILKEFPEEKMIIGLK